ncbi:BTB/POZ domain-containing protein 7 [Folsomia candida]|uniref:BTB/POZ domain-containing protein 7 n=1 Tax=Folsomia candida TaxID=158441 RepID=A0A226EVR8_FOLCA|nr:BTB/POZ domain-containing protein 7 [Folsomia candida]
MGANLSDVSNGGGSRGGGLNNPDCTQDDCFINAARERKKKWWRRRTSRSTDPGRPLREILSSWTIGEVYALMQEYDMMTKEKELYIQSESARPRIQTIRSDLADLLDFKWNSDVNLYLTPAIFPAHRAILMQRSKYFRSLLHHQNGIVNVNIEDPVDIPTFSSFIRYLYTEESSAELDNFADTIFGHNGRSRSLEVDLRELLQTAKYSDVVLVVGDEHIPCHKAVLAARSAFFRSLFQRRGNSKNLVLDETVIPKRYTRVS